MEKMIFSWIILILWNVVSADPETYYLEDYCDDISFDTIDMISEDTYQGRLRLDGSFQGDRKECTVTIESWYSNNRIMFYFETLDLYQYGNDNASYLQVFNGQPGDYDYTPINGLRQPIRGFNKPTGSFHSTSRYLTFKFVKDDNYYDNQFDVIFTAYHTGTCRSFEYRCSNGRCIDDDINCNGFNPCGDNSDCGLSGGAIAGITIGVVFGVCFIATITYLICRQSRRKMAVPYQPIAQPTVHTAVVAAVPPPPNYNTVMGYPGQAQYGTVNANYGVQQATPAGMSTPISNKA